MSKRNLLDLAALSDPTDSHSLAELRAHLVDEGILPDLDTPLTDAQWDIVHHAYESGTAVLREWNAQNARLASERSGGDGA